MRAILPVGSAPSSPEHACRSRFGKVDRFDFLGFRVARTLR